MAQAVVSLYEECAEAKTALKKVGEGRYLCMAQLCSQQTMLMPFIMMGKKERVVGRLHFFHAVLLKKSSFRAHRKWFRIANRSAVFDSADV